MQPAAKAMPRGIDADERENSPQRPVAAVFERAGVTAHAPRTPGGIPGEIADVVPVRIVRQHEDHRVVRAASAQGRGARIEHPAARRVVLEIACLARLIRVVAYFEIPTHGRILTGKGMEAGDAVV